MAPDLPPPPRSLVQLEAARRRFGPGRVALLTEMVQTGDPLADAATRELRTGGEEARRASDLGLRHGAAFLDDRFPALRALLAAAEADPPWLDRARLARGSEAYLAIGNVWITLSLGPGSLTHTYSSPSIARVLVRTGNLTRMARRRIIETGVWNIETALPGGLERGAGGYVHNLQVRLLHAGVRASLRARGWDDRETGAPINQVEMARTWLDFTYVPFRALGAFGISFSHAELDDLYHFWRYVAHLLGVDPRLYGDVTDQAQAGELLALINGTMEPATDDTRQLTREMLVAVAELLQPSLRLPPPLILHLTHALARQLHGDALADRLAIRRPPIRLALPLLTLANRLRRAHERLWPRQRARAIRATVAYFREQLATLEGPTTYQRPAEGPGGLPVTQDPPARP